MKTERAEGDRGLRVEVDPRRGVDEQARPADPRLDRRLDEDVERALERDDRPRVLEGGRRGARLVGESAHDAVALVGAPEQRDLPQRVERTVREEGEDALNADGHRRAMLTIRTQAEGETNDR
jgi:hypothetical protein